MFTDAHPTPTCSSEPVDHDQSARVAFVSSIHRVARGGSCPARRSAPASRAGRDLCATSTSTSRPPARSRSWEQRPSEYLRSQGSCQLAPRFRPRRESPSDRHAHRRTPTPSPRAGPGPVPLAQPRVQRDSPGAQRICSRATTRMTSPAGTAYQWALLRSATVQSEWRWISSERAS
jgi:hypothetical protein